MIRREALAARRSAIASAAESLIGSAMPSRPGRPAVDRDEDNGLARRGAGPRPVRRAAPASIPSSSSSAGLPTATAGPSTRALDAPAGVRAGTPRPWVIVSPRSRAAAGDRRGQRVLARLLQARGQAQQLRLVLAGRRPRPRPPAACPRSACRSCRPPACRPVPSTSSASAFLTSTPAAAPRPVPTMIDIGVASPSAHGQAMISTATALTSACARRGSGPKTAQATNVIRATRITPGTK